MKVSNYLLLICLLFTACKISDLGKNKETNERILEEAKTYKNFRGYEPVDPVEFEDKILIANDQNSIILKDMKLLNREEILGFLNNETVLVSIGQLNRDGAISYLPITLSQKNTSYKITMDYMKYATLAQVSNNQFIGSKRVGVGLRLISLITTAETGINIGDLYAIGLAAKEGKLSGTMIIEVIGIKSKEVTTLIPLPSEINQTTIQNAMQALATIKSKIYDEETRLYPQVMAIKKYKNEEIQIVKTNGDTVFNIENAIEDHSIQLQFGNIKFSSEEKQEEASLLLVEALRSIINKNIETSIKSLQEYEQAFPLYSVDIVLDKLEESRTDLQDKNSPEWKKVYQLILDNYAERLPSSVIQKLENS
ncbi:hypothetical protein [Gramella sp. MAR_2010_147]|uniref:hypothetical protein n=1 Tax=Gramella sp. MAR_2010_147 TaxID=1250205 RepID=UPI00087D57C2|nr:hypothetical protein [Gramella sp. MAR_2010_147]SDS63456.1 hypothetical protein SAMN04488553_2719 [Gramella sp. MAR_2010_147]